MLHTSLCHSLDQLRGKSRPSEKIILDWIALRSHIMHELPGRVGSVSIALTIERTGEWPRTFFGGTIAMADFGVIDMWLPFSRSFFKLLRRACKKCIVSTGPLDQPRGWQHSESREE